MYLRIGNRILNTDNIVEARVFPALPEREDDEEPGRVLPPKSVGVEVITTAVVSEYDHGGDYRTPNTVIHPHTIMLAGDEAERFLEALPVYEPVRETE